MYEHTIQTAVQVVVEHVYAVAYRLGVLDVDSDEPLSRWMAIAV